MATFDEFYRSLPEDSKKRGEYFVLGMHPYLNAIDLTSKRSLLPGGFQKHGLVWWQLFRGYALLWRNWWFLFLYG
jgi:hypothetical protein